MKIYPKTHEDISPLFKNNKQSSLYYRIIYQAKIRDATYREYSERHHIIPRSLGGGNDTNNIVQLTAKEHYICHALLCYMCVSTMHHYKMLNAFQMMQVNQNGKRYTSKLYEYFKKSIADSKMILNSGEKNPFFGKKHTEASKERMKANRPDRSGANNPRYGQKHSEATKKLMSRRRKESTTELTRKKISEAHKNRTLSEEHKKKLSKAGMGKTRSATARIKLSQQKIGTKNPNYGKVYTPEERDKLSKARAGIKPSLAEVQRKRISRCLNLCKIILEHYGSVTDENICDAKSKGFVAKTQPNLTKLTEVLGIIPATNTQIDHMMLCIRHQHGE